MKFYEQKNENAFQKFLS